MVQEKDELIRKRVLYIGSAVPIETAEGLDGIQKPLRERYPTDDDNNIEGILSYISIVPSGITLQYVSDPSRILFFPITSLTLCAAVRCVTTVNQTTGERTARFLSLSNPQAGGANSKRPAIFTTITRRTEGRKVLECHGFICSSSKDALELVQYTSYADKLSKGKLNGTVMPPAAPASQTYHLEGGHSPRHFETNTLKSTSAVSSAAAPVPGPDGEHPVRLVPGEVSSQRVAPEFYEPPPQHGYFYKTRDSQIKTYAVERVLDGESERLRTVSPPAAATTTLPRAPPSERRSMYAGPPPATMTMPQRTPTLIPVRAVPAVSSATIVRPRFFSPPPPLLRPRPVAMPIPPGHPMGRDPYVFLPPPPNIIDAPYVIRRKPQRRGSDSSSRGSSRSSSPASPREMNGDGRRVVNGDGADGSSDVSSRPRTPPTDYERGPRVSRREQFDRRRGIPLREINGDFGTMPGPHPYDFYVYPPRYPYHAAGYPPYMMERARSVPPPAGRGKSKDRKKDRKGKKSKKHGKSRVYGVPSDISTDSVGYTSEISPGMDRSYPRMPRDFRRFENQFKHERAFSKSLAEENRGGPGDPTGNAYSLNEHMAQRGDADFNLY
nr:hypothetical protein BaRGS_030065 [Batillaria attramentaria]